MQGPGHPSHLALPDNGSGTHIAELAEAMFEHLVCKTQAGALSLSFLVQLRPALQAAVLTDTGFFLSDKHPARRLIETIITAGVACNGNAGASDPLYAFTDTVVARLARQDLTDGSIIERAISQIDAAVACADWPNAAALQQAIVDAADQDHLSRAQEAAEQALALRLVHAEVPDFVEAFLQDQWKQVLALIYDLGDTEPRALTIANGIIDDLIHSVQPKADPEERHAMVARLPQLLAQMNGWLDRIHWIGPERSGFFDALAQRHAAVLRPPAGVMARQQLEIRMNAVQRASEHQINRREREQEEEALSGFLQQIGQLQPGQWMAFVRNDDSVVNCRLLWISPGHQRLVFMRRFPPLVFTLTAETLAQAMRAERSRILRTQGLTGQAIAAAIHSMTRK